MFDRFPVLSTERLQLREVTLQDMDAATELYGAPMLMKEYQGQRGDFGLPRKPAAFPDHHSLPGHLEQIGVFGNPESRNPKIPKRDTAAYRIQEWFVTPYQEQKGIRFGIYLNNSNRLIGSCGFHRWNKTHYKAELVYELHPQFHRRGVIKEALTALLKFGFESMDLNRIEARIESTNRAAQRTLFSLGFQHEGTERQAEYSDGEFIDILFFSRLKNDGPPAVHIVK
ncbi:putative ribosomal N-acetyltransferase YdaF [compost metagenome]